MELSHTVSRIIANVNRPKTRSAKEKQDSNIVSGYIRRMVSKIENMEIPIDIINVCFNFYHSKIRVLQFDRNLKSKELHLKNDGMWVTAKMDADSHRYALTTEDPVYEGTHCWRVQMELMDEVDENKYSNIRWIMWGVSDKRPFEDQSYKESWGISYANQWFPWDETFKSNVMTNKKELGGKTDSIFRMVQGMEVDIKFDVDKRILTICVVGKCESGKEAKIWKFGKRKY